MNKQLKILENKMKGIETSILRLSDLLDTRKNFLCREDPLFQKLLEEARMEKVRLNDMSEFMQIMEKQTNESGRPGTTKKIVESSGPKRGKPKIAKAIE